MLQSDFARSFDQKIAAAASLGLITTYDMDGGYGRCWRITQKGMEIINAE